MVVFLSWRIVMFSQKRAFSFLILSLVISFILAGCVLPFSSQEGEGEATATADPNQGGGVEQPAAESDGDQPAIAETAQPETEMTEETAVPEETTVAETPEETTTEISEEESNVETQPVEEDTAEATAVQPTQEPSQTSPVSPTTSTTTTSTTTTSTTTCPVTHTVQPGENLYRIGLQYNMSWVPIAQANGLPNPNAIYVGQVLVIPVAGCTPVPPLPPPGGGTTYVVQPGDNLYQIGLKFGVSWVQIAEANGIVNPNQIYVGQVLKIPVAQPGPTPNFTHVVQYGETLYTISIHYGVPWQAIAAANQIPPPYIVYAGQTIIIPGSW